MKCLNGHENVDRAQYCATCGVSIGQRFGDEGPTGEPRLGAKEDPATSANDNHGASETRNNTNLRIGLAIGALVVLVVIGVVVGTRGTSPGGSNQSTPSEKISIDVAATAVEADITSLQNDGDTLTSDLSGFIGNLAQEKTDLAITAKEEGVVIAESKNGTDSNQVCSDSDTVQSDADNVGSDGDTVSSTANGVEGDISTLRSDIAAIQQNLATLKSAQSLLPTYNDGAPSQSSVDEAVTTTQAAIQSALTTANGDIAQANSYEVLAYQDAVAAAKAGNCAPPATQFTQPTIP